MNDVLATQPLGPELLRRALVAKLASGQADSARVLARRLLAIAPDAPLARLSLAAGDFKAGRFESAKARLATIGGRGPDAIYSSLLSAWAEAGSGRHDAAIEILRRPGGGRNPLAVYSHHSALILDLADRPEEAERHYLDALRQMPQPTARLTLAVGSFYRRMGNAAEAERRYTAFLAERQPSPLIESALADLRAGKPAARLVSDAVEGAAEVFFVAANFGIRTRLTEFALVYGRFALRIEAPVSIRPCARRTDTPVRRPRRKGAGGLSIGRPGVSAFLARPGCGARTGFRGWAARKRPSGSCA